MQVGVTTTTVAGTNEENVHTRISIQSLDNHDYMPMGTLDNMIKTHFYDTVDE